MKIVLIVIVLCVVVLLAVLYGEKALRLFHSAILIAQARPYERSIPNADVLLIIGDSTAYGTGASVPQESVAGRMGVEFQSYTIVNKGKNGQKVAELVASFEDKQIPMGARLMLIQIGGNDILQFTDTEQLRSDVRTLFTLAKEHAESVVVMTSGNVGGASAFAPYGSEASLRYEEQTRAVRALFIEEASRSEVTYVDLFQEPAEDVFIQEPKRYLASDGLHPSSEGYLVWYQALRPSLQMILSR